MLAIPLAVAAAGGLLLQVLSGPSLTGDFDGSGVGQVAGIAVTATGTELEIADRSGRPLVRAPLPVAPSRAGAVAFSRGPLGSAGELLETTYPGAEGNTCREVWRFREGRLAALPVRGPERPLPKCPEPGWTYRWERPDPKAPSLYVRERSQATPEGLTRDVEAYAFSGFELVFDPNLSHREIRGVAIPDWPEVVFYPRALLEETLFSRFGLSRLRSASRLKILASQSEYRFELQVEDPSGARKIFPVCSATRGKAEREVRLTAEAGGRTVRATIALGGPEAMIPVEAAILGLGPADDTFYVPVLRRELSAWRIYPSAEDEIASVALPGRWSSQTGRVIDIAIVSGFPALLRVAGREVSLSIAGAPGNVDLLLVPRDGSPPTAGFTLEGPERISWVPLACDSSSVCRAAGARESLRRMGSRLN